MTSKSNLAVWVLTIALVLCTSYACCHNSYLGMPSKKDATHLKRESFTLVQVTYNHIGVKCIDEKKKCEKSPEMLKINSMSASGSGAVIAHTRGLTYVMTAAHVCEHKFPTEYTVGDAKYLTKTKSNITLYDLYGAGHKAKIVYADQENDICIVKSKGTWGSPLKLAGSMPRHGERVYNIAAPFGMYSPKMVLMFEGFYAGIDMRGNEFYTLPCRPGSSGSPILNSSGELIGIIHSASVMFENVALASRLDTITEAIKAHVPPDLDPTTLYLWHQGAKF